MTITTRDREGGVCRRQRRASAAGTAIGYQLLHLAEELQLGAIVVADDVGHPLSLAGDARLAGLLAESALWSAFAHGAVDDFTLARIRWARPEIRASHIASSPVGRPEARGARVVAAGSDAADAVARTVASIDRICRAANENADRCFFDAFTPTASPDLPPATPVAKDVGVRWVIGQTASR